jgi:transcriptional regulator with XRE-family HTH domain
LGVYVLNYDAKKARREIGLRLQAIRKEHGKTEADISYEADLDGVLIPENRVKGQLELGVMTLTPSIIAWYAYHFSTTASYILGLSGAKDTGHYLSWGDVARWQTERLPTVLKNCRVTAGLTADQMFDKLYVPLGYTHKAKLYQAERGSRPTSHDVLITYSEYFGKNLEWLYGLETEEELYV